MFVRRFFLYQVIFYDLKKTKNNAIFKNEYLQVSFKFPQRTIIQTWAMFLSIHFKNHFNFIENNLIIENFDCAIVKNLPVLHVLSLFFGGEDFHFDLNENVFK